MKDDVKLWLAIYGRIAGVIVMLVPAIWDIAYKGLRNGEQIKVCLPGIVIMFSGFGIYKLAEWMERNLK